MKPELASALERLGWVEVADADERPRNVPSEASGTERDATVALRVGQNVFRSQLLQARRGCDVSGCRNTEVLSASHIVPWSRSNPKERVDISNGLLLIPNLDRLFDRRLISFQDSGQILICPKLDLAARKALGLTGEEKLQSVAPRMRRFLARHRRAFRQGGWGTPARRARFSR